MAMRPWVVKAKETATAKQAADDAKRAAESTGELFDPRTDPRTAVVYNADGSTGQIDKRTELASRRNQVTNRAMNAYGAADDAVAGSRARADAATTGQPTYTARDPYVTPTYTAPDDFSFRDWTGEREALEDDDAVEARFQRYSTMLGANPGSDFDYTPERVGDYGGAFQSWLTGAQASFGDALKRQASDLNESAAARGRLNSGFYNEDYGSLQSRIASEFGNAAQMAALDAAGLSLRGAEANASNALKAAEMRYKAGQDAYADRRTMLADALKRSEYLDTTRDGRYESDRDFYERDRDFASGRYDTDRTFGRRSFENDRDFGADRYNDDRDFDYQRYRDDTGDWRNNRDFAEDRFRFDTGQRNNDRDFYADWLSGETDRDTDNRRYQASQPSGFERAVGTALPIVKTALPFLAPGVGSVAAAALPGGATNGVDVPTPATRRYYDRGNYA